MYPRTISGHQIFISRSTFYVSRNTNRFRFVWREPDNTSTVIQSPAASVEADKWYYVVATHDGTTGRLYVDGQLAAESATASGNIPGAAWDIGRHYNSATNWFDGLIDNVGIYAAPLNQP